MTVPRPRTLALIAIVLLATACANFSAISPGTPAQQIQSTFGKPGTVWKNPDGSEVWEYPQGPVGVQTYMIAIGSNQEVREVRQVLSEEYLDKVQAGMSRDDVRRLIGKPGETAYFPARDEEVWTWRIQEFHFRYRRFHALFDRTTGILRSTLIIDEERPDNDKRSAVTNLRSASRPRAQPSPHAQA
jgi:outer membrane protein assembly factor BamE (lipoprotein component of BamABCDE complex)